MLKLNDEILTSIPSKERSEFKDWLYDYYGRVIREYRYLGFSEEYWNKIIEKAISLSIGRENFYASITKKIESYVRKYVNKNYENRDIRIFNNMLKVFQATSQNNLLALREFVKKLKSFKIEFDSNFLNFLKINSGIFRNILDALGFNDCKLEDFKRLIKGDFDCYIDFIIMGKSLKESIVIIDRVKGNNDLST